MEAHDPDSPLELLRKAVENTANQRRRRAEMYPSDNRLTAAAERLGVLAAKCGKGEVSADLLAEYAKAFAVSHEDDDCQDAVEAEQAALRAVGLDRFPENVDEFLKDVLDRISKGIAQ